MSIIHIDNIKKIYGKDDAIVEALKGISLTINEGDFISIMGPSGCGKSSLLNILGCIDKPSSGTYTLYGQEVNTLSFNELASIRNSTISFIFQNFALMNNFTVIDNIMLPLMVRKMSTNQMRKKALEVLDKLDILDKKDKKISQISGGQQQRVAIARALVQESKIILADEPTGALDEENSLLIMKLLKDLNTQERKTLIVVTHDPIVSNFSHKKINIKNGLIVN